LRTLLVLLLLPSPCLGYDVEQVRHETQIQAIHLQSQIDKTTYILDTLIEKVEND